MHEEETEPAEEREREFDGSMRWCVTLWTCCCEMLTSLVLLLMGSLLIGQSIENKVYDVNTKLNSRLFYVLFVTVF